MPHIPSDACGVGQTRRRGGYGQLSGYSSSVNSPDEEPAIEDEDGLDYQWSISLKIEELTLI